MADANVDGVVNTNGSDDQNQNNEAQDSKQVSDVTSPESEVARLQAELAKANEILEKSRKAEKYAKLSKSEIEAQHQELTKKLTELDSFKQRAELAEQKLFNMVMDTELNAQASKHAKDADAAKALVKLIDRAEIKVVDGVVDTKSVEDAFSKAKSEFGFLFKQATVPEMRRSTEGQAIGGFKAEMDAAKTVQEVNAVLKKYGHKGTDF